MIFLFALIFLLVIHETLLLRKDVLELSEKAVLTDSPTSKFAFKGDQSVWILQAHMPGVLDPCEPLFLKVPPEYPNCDNVAPSDVIWKTIDDRLGIRLGNLVLIIREVITEYLERKLYNSGLEQLKPRSGPNDQR